jgi:hypothetical protein
VSRRRPNESNSAAFFASSALEELSVEKPPSLSSHFATAVQYTPRESGFPRADAEHAAGGAGASSAPPEAPGVVRKEVSWCHEPRPANPRFGGPKPPSARG